MTSPTISICDDGVGLSRQQRLQGCAYPLPCSADGSLQQGVGGVPRKLRGRADVQEQGVLQKLGHHLLWQRLGAIGERHLGLDVGSLALDDPRRQPTHTPCLPLQGGRSPLPTGHGLRPLGIWQQGSHHRLRGAWVWGKGEEARDRGLLLPQ